MRLLIHTQKVSAKDDVLGFFHRHIEELAKHFEKVTVVCLEEGEHRFPNNVSVHSLGKEKGATKKQQILTFYKYLWRFRKDYDAVFVHMNPEYVVLGGLLWRLWRKRIGLSYIHRAVNLKLRVATFFAHVIFTASESSFGIKSRKVHILGHGIDVEHFDCGDRQTFGSMLRIVVVGRITPIKHTHFIIDVARELFKALFPFKITFVGGPVSKEDREYFEKAKGMVAAHGLEKVVVFEGSVPYEKIKDYYCGADMTLNMLPTGGIDKTVAEAMAARVVPITSNEGFKNFFGPYADTLIISFDDPKIVAERIKTVAQDANIPKIQTHLQNAAKEHFSVERLISRINELLV